MGRSRWLQRTMMTPDSTNETRALLVAATAAYHTVIDIAAPFLRCEIPSEAGVVSRRAACLLCGAVAVRLLRPRPDRRRRPAHTAGSGRDAPPLPQPHRPWWPRSVALPMPPQA